MKAHANDSRQNKREAYEGIIKDCEHQIRQLSLRKALMLKNLKELDDERDKTELIQGRPR